MIAFVEVCKFCNISTKKSLKNVEFVMFVWQIKIPHVDISFEITNYLTSNKTATSKEICKHISKKEDTILVNLQQLLSEEKIGINNFNQYYII